jgi:hypothetical protein
MKSELRWRRSRCLLAMAAILSTTSGCQYFYHPWYLVEIDARRTTTPEKESEVTVDRSIRRPSSLVFAVFAPDECSNRGAATASGEAKTESVELQVDCGEAMGNIERAIVKRGWQVVSWKSIDQAVKSGRAANALDAAASLQANMLMQINSLEISLKRGFGKGELSRTIRKSDYRGTPGPPVSVEAERGEAIDRMIDPIVESLNPPEQLGAFIDVTLIDVATGRSAWFYKWNHQETDRDMDVSVTRLFLCHRRILRRCFPRELKARPVNRPDVDPHTQKTIDLGGPDSSRAANAVARRLLDEATSDMLTQLATWVSS